MKRILFPLGGVLLWLIPFIVFCALVIHDPEKRSVTSLYHDASEHWWAGEGLYVGPGGMNYLPSFAVLFAPFHLFPRALGDILWRGLAMGLLIFGIWRALRVHFRENLAESFLWTSLMVMPISLAALRNGQANAMFSALTLCAIVFLSEKGWWKAAACMSFAVMVKPLGIVLMLLTPALYPAMFVPVLVAFFGSFALPFFFASPGYVLEQYRACFANLSSCAVVSENRFADINGIIRSLGFELPDRASKLIRAGAGAAFLGLFFFGGRRWREPERALWLYALATGYLMLFNPMNEYNGYVIFAPAMGLWSVWLIRHTEAKTLGWVLAGLTVSTVLVPTLLQPIYRNAPGIIWPPIVATFFLLLLSARIFRLVGPAPRGR